VEPFISYYSTRSDLTYVDLMFFLSSGFRVGVFSYGVFRVGVFSPRIAKSMILCNYATCYLYNMHTMLLPYHVFDVLGGREDNMDQTDVATEDGGGRGVCYLWKPSAKYWDSQLSLSSPNIRWVIPIEDMNINEKLIFFFLHMTKFHILDS
jgi:hypothetical protein